MLIPVLMISSRVDIPLIIPPIPYLWTLVSVLQKEGNMIHTQVAEKRRGEISKHQRWE